MLLGGWMGCAHQVPATPVSEGFALAGVTVWTGDGSPPRSGQTVVVQNGRIVAIGSATPKGLPVIDGGGRFVMPGLADMHAHLPDAEPDDAITVDQALDLALAYGVTTVRSMRGTPEQLALRDRIAAGEVEGPRLIVGAPVGDLLADAVPAAIAEIDAAGYDFVKLMGGVDREAYAALARECAAHGLLLAGHVPPEIPLDDVLASGQCVEHLHALSGAVREGTPPAEVAAAAHRANVWSCPTLDYAAVVGGILASSALEARPGLDRVPEADLARWRSEQIAPADDAFREEYARRQQLVAALAAEGAGLLATANHGPYMVPGCGMREELARWEEGGVTPQQALVAASQGSAARWSGAEGWGDLAVGNVADLLVLDASPLEDLDNLHRIHAVVRAGRWIAPAM